MKLKNGQQCNVNKDGTGDLPRNWEKPSKSQKNLLVGYAWSALPGHALRISAVPPRKGESAGDRSEPTTWSQTRLLQPSARTGRKGAQVSALPVEAICVSGRSRSAGQGQGPAGATGGCVQLDTAAPPARLPRLDPACSARP